VAGDPVELLDETSGPIWVVSSSPLPTLMLRACSATPSTTWSYTDSST
jgi:hypothetical protein